MGPLSAVAVAFLFIMLGLTWIGWITVATHGLGVIALICAALVLIDTFWHYGRPYLARTRVQP
jgi:hypothetical protein